MAYSAEPIPVEAIKDVLNDYWDTQSSQIPLPNIVVSNQQKEPIRFDMRDGDWFVIKPDVPAEEKSYIGNWFYANERHRILVEIWTKENRQRLYDLKQELIRVLEEKLHGVTSFQRVRFDSFNEPIGTSINVWHARIIVVLENNAVRTGRTAL